MSAGFAPGPPNAWPGLYRPSAFTPGPWTAELTDTPYAEIGETWVVDAEIGSVCTLDGPKDEREANARLIAAAPDLHEAGEEALVDLDDLIERMHANEEYLVAESVIKTRDKMRAALAKARGEQ